MEKNEKEEISVEEAARKLVKRDRYLGVLWERIDGKLSIVIEGNDALEQKIDKVDAKLETFKAEANEKFGMLFGEVKRIDGVESRLDGVESRLGTLEGGVKRLLEDNQEFFGELRTVKADVANLDRRVTVLEK